MNRTLLVSLIVISSLYISGCQSASHHRQEVSNTSDQKLTVGTVQREITVGMPASKVVEVLGSPNVVTTDEKRREVWVYDKISTERAYSENRGAATLILLGASGGAGASSTSQRTLTIIIKYDENNLVRDFAYHASRF